MGANTQNDYALRKTGNYLDLIEGAGYHSQPLTFHEFLSKPESLFMYDETFMQNPGYVQDEATLMYEVEEDARQYVAEYIMNEFEHNLLGMQDYVRWAKLFEHRCAEITPAFWAQVNMHDTLYAHELRRDENVYNRTNTGNASRLGGQTVTTDQTGSSTTTGSTSTVQDVDNTQSTDSSNREGAATVIRAENQLSDDLNYNWSDAADSVRESRSRAGDTNQHMESKTDSESNTESQSRSVSTTFMDNSNDSTTATGKDMNDLTNKQYQLDRQMAINTARSLLPLTWLREQLRPLFYMIY